MPDPPADHRRFGLATAAALVVGEVIGVGIFLTPSEMARALGSPFWLMLAWGSMGLIALCGALAFGALAARHPEDGGGYVYLRRAIGPRPAFLFGWLSLLVTDPGLTAMLATGLARYAGAFAPLTDGGARGVAIGSIVLMAGLNVAGARIGAGVLKALAALKLGLLAAIAGWGLASGAGDWSNFTPFAERPAGADPLAGAMVGALLGAFFSMAGFWDLGKISGEVRDPERTMPRAMVLGVSAVTLAYMLVSAVFWYLVPWQGIDTDEGFAAQAGRVLFGAAGARIFAGVVVLSVLGSLAALLMAAPRVYQAMAADGLFPAGLARNSPRLGTPARSTLLLALIASLLAATGTFEQILSYMMAPTLAILALIVATSFIRAPASGPGRAPGHPFTPLGFLVPIVLIVAMQLLRDPIRAGGGLAIVAFGLPMYEVMKRRARPTA
jgi:APA family basic amino acid/polyamine antiporter